MAPTTLASANLAYDKAVTKLKRACVELERNLPPQQEIEGGDAIAPSLRPRERVDSVAACAICAQELETLEAGARDAHACTHREQREPTDNDNVSTAGSQGDEVERTINARRARGKQPKIGVIKEYMAQLNTCLDAYTDAVCVLCSVLGDQTAGGLSRSFTCLGCTLRTS